MVGRHRSLSVVLLALGVLAAACSSDDSESSTDDADEVSLTMAVEGGDGTATGQIVRSVAINEDGDGKGRVQMTVDTDCRNDLGTGFEPLGLEVVEDADLSSESGAVDFTITGLADGTYYASAWLDDIDNPDQDEALPATGDLVMFGDLSPRCQPFDVADGVADDVVVDLNYDMPFTLPGLEAESGVLEGDAEAPVGPIEDDGNTYTVSVDVARSVEPDLGGDGTGPFIGSLSEACFDDQTGEVPVPLFPVLLEEASLPESDSVLPIVIENVPNGVYFFNAFIDDASDGESAPRPGIGDLVSFGGIGPACAQVVVDGADATATLDLNLVMPFDL